jgi:hypothetical protein
LDPVGQRRDLPRLVEVVGPPVVDDAAELVPVDEILGVADLGAVHRLVRLDVGWVCRVDAFAVHVGDKELADLLLQSHVPDLVEDPAVLDRAAVAPTAVLRSDGDPGVSVGVRRSGECAISAALTQRASVARRRDRAERWCISPSLGIGVTRVPKTL